MEDKLKLPDFIDLEIKDFLDADGWNIADIFSEITDWYWSDSESTPSNVYDWLSYSENRNLLMKALVFGYEVEQEVN